MKNDNKEQLMATYHLLSEKDKEIVDNQLRKEMNEMLNEVYSEVKNGKNNPGL
jgi:glutathionyl-hydroquinone reductase